jgi:hypothetical protein
MSRDGILRHYRLDPEGLGRRPLTEIASRWSNLLLSCARPPIFSDAEKERRQSQYPSGRGTAGAVPLPMSDPRKADMPPVQSMCKRPSAVWRPSRARRSLRSRLSRDSYFTALVERAENAIKLAGSLITNGPGSTGRSTPDGAAPTRPSTGGFPWLLSFRR